MIGHKCPLKHSFGSFHFASISSFQFFTSPPIPTHPTPQMTHPTKKKKSMNNYVQMVPFQNYLLLMDARRATGKPTGSLLSLSLPLCLPYLLCSGLVYTFMVIILLWSSLSLLLSMELT